MMKRLSLFILLLVSNIFATSLVLSNNQIDNELYQSCIDIKSGLNVLNISLKPGYEDLSALAYYRFGQGAKIMSAYITNGECTESDSNYYFPHQIAAKLRQESFAAISSLKGETYYLSFPEIISASNDEKIYSLWNKDSLKNKLYNLISTFKPDVILLSRDWYFENKNRSIDILIDKIVEVISGNHKDVSWKVSRFYYDDPSKKGVKIPVDTKDLSIPKTYRVIGEDAGKYYESILWQLKNLKSSSVPSYSLIYPIGNKYYDDITKGLPSYDTEKLKKFKKDIDNFATALMKNQKYVDANRKYLDRLKYLSILSDSVNTYLSYRMNLSQTEYKLFLNWKINLDKIRNSLLGVKLYYSINETILTNRQLTILQFDSISGLSKNGTTELYFPGVDEDWVINESSQKSHPFLLGQEYRILSPANLEYSYPYEIYNLDKNFLKNRFYFFIIHSSNIKEENFVYKQNIQFDYSPRFTAEILTPIVRVIPGEKIIIRLTNHSRDGVADYIHVDDTLVTSNSINFQLSYKGAQLIDTLNLTWSEDVPNRDVLIPIKIVNTPVANFFARKFDAVVDTSKRIAVISAVQNSVLGGALKRLQARYLVINSPSHLIQIIDSVDVIIVDYRTMSFKKEFIKDKAIFEQFVNRGGHLIILPQDAKVWNEISILSNLKLETSFQIDEESPVHYDTTHRLLNIPNLISEVDFEGWIFKRGYNRIRITPTPSTSIPVKTNLLPLIVTKAQSKGKITYVDLALHHQWLNIHPGSFKLIANLISY